MESNRARFKNSGFVFSLSLLILALTFQPVTFAAPGVPAPGASAIDASQIGVAAAVKGIVKLSKSSAVGRDIKSGEAIYLGDNITTDANSNLQILLLDQTVFTIGPNSSIVVDKFVYDPATADGNVNIKVAKGVFRFVTGKIGHKDPSKMNIDLPSGTIGIRGTIGAGQTDGQKSLVLLLGPGENNNTSSRRGALVITDKGISIDLVRTGYGTELDGQNPPTEPFLVPVNRLAEMETGLSGGGEDSGGEDDSSGSGGGGGNQNDGGSEGGDSASKNAGQDRAGAGKDVKNSSEIGTVFTKLDKESDRASQDSVAEESILNTTIDRITTFEDLSRLSGGIIKFTQNNVPLFDQDADQAGDYDIVFEINLGSRQLGGGDSSIAGSVGDNSFDFSLPSRSFGSQGPVVYQYTAEYPTVSNNLEVSTVIVPFNQGGTVAHNIVHAVQVDVIGEETSSFIGGGATPGSPSTGHQG